MKHHLPRHRLARPRSVLNAVRYFIRMVSAAAWLPVLSVSVAHAGQVYVRLWGSVGPYEAAVIAPFGSVTKLLNRNTNNWSFRNYAAASMGGLAISARESVVSTLGNGAYDTHQQTNSNARWEDTVTINAPGMTGAAGVMTLTYRVNGQMTFNGTYAGVPDYNHAYLSSSVLINNTSVDLAQYELYPPGPTPYPDFLNADRTIQAGFTFGTPFVLRHELHARTAIDVRNGIGKIAEVVVSSLWKGITVQHQSAPVTNFTASSSTVPIWSQQLPPPMPPLNHTVQTNQLVFTWPEPAACVLKVSQNLRDWTPSATQPAVNDMIKTLTVPITNGLEFFRLESTP